MDFALTPSGADHKISPESSDGLASVGTILPRRRGRPVAGWPFPFFGPPIATTPDRRYNPTRNVQTERADVAQLVEQLIRNQQVIGSSPIVGSSLARLNN